MQADCTPSCSLSQEDQLLKQVSDSTFDQFMMPHRSVSNVTVVPSMYLSWHDVNAYTVDTGSTSSCWNYCLEKDVEANKVKQQKTVLSNVFGAANPGEVLAIIGPSGAGKTTLLNIMSQQNIGALRVEGSIKVNGLRVSRDYMKKVSAYVQQEDCFIGSLTVEEHLTFMARLRMSKQYSKADQRRRVRQIIGDLGLRESAHTIIGTRTRRGLSGGEKKRLAFASEILTSPPILLCDEPTSGLDSFLAFQVISVLKRLAEKKGMTVVLTIHQPSSQVFELFNRVYVLSEGRVAFCGSQPQAFSMWNELGSPVPQNFNPADHYISTLAVTQENSHTQVQKIMAVCDYYETSAVGKEIARDAKARDSRSRESSSESIQWRKYIKENGKSQVHASWFLQFRVLTQRNIKTTLREPTLLKVQIMQSVIIALLTGIIYLKNSVSQKEIMNINGALFQMITEMAFMFQFSAVYNFSLEFPTFYREYNSNLYGISSYFLAKNIAELPTYTLSAVIFSGILYWMSGLVPFYDAFLLYVIVAVLVQNIAISFGYAFGCIFDKLSTAMAVLPIFVVPMMAFGGFFINQDSLPIYFWPLKYLSHVRFAFESLVINEWRYIERIPGNCTATLQTCRKNGEDVISSLSFRSDMMWINVGWMFVMMIVIRTIAFVGLYCKTKSKK